MVQGPKRYYSIMINKGRRAERHIVTWDAVGDCEGDTCKIFHLCQYQKRGKCTVQVRYLSELNKMIERNYDDSLDEPGLYKIGIHLVPLYKTLCKLMIEELGTRRVTYVTDSGMVKVQPIYKEIRDTISMIMKVWKDLGLNGPPPDASHLDHTFDFIDAVEDEEDDHDHDHDNNNFSTSEKGMGIEEGMERYGYTEER